MPQPSRRRSWKLVTLALVVLAAGVLIDWHQIEPLFRSALSHLSNKTDSAARQPQRAPAVPVTAARAETGDFPIVLTGLGTVQPYNSVLVRTRVDGQIIKIHFDEGELVHEGDLLAEIDPRPYQAALDQALAKRQQDEATIGNARRDLNRSQSLAKSEFATRQQLDTQTAQVAQLTGQLAADDAAIENARTQLDYTNIRAPLTGRTGFRLVDQGNIANAASATGIVSIAQVEPIAVVFTAPEDRLPEISAGLSKGPLDVTASTSDGTAALADGKLEVFNNEIDTASGTIRLKAAFENKDRKLWPGLSVSTKLTVAVRHDVVLVPATAIQRGPNGLYVFVIRSDDKVEQQAVKVGMLNDERAAIDDGVKSGDQVVTAGQYRLQQNTLVKTAPPAAAQQTSQRDS